MAIGKFKGLLDLSYLLLVEKHLSQLKLSSWLFNKRGIYYIYTFRRLQEILEIDRYCTEGSFYYFQNLAVFGTPTIVAGKEIASGYSVSLL